MEVAGKRILVLGAGKSGLGALKLLCERGARAVLYDENEGIDKEEIKGEIKGGENIQVILGEFPKELPEKPDMAVISPGISPGLLQVRRLRDRKSVV